VGCGQDETNAKDSDLHIRIPDFCFCFDVRLIPSQLPPLKMLWAQLELH
jgi:hypothetical protein